MATIQIDLVMLPERFDLTYIDEDGQPQRPIAIHRAIYGSLERFIGILVEHFAGAFPVWLAPVQAVVIPIADRHIEAAEELAGVLRSRGVRVEVDDSSNRMQYKIRTAQEQKVPYMLVLGDREIEARQATVRRRGAGQGRGPGESGLGGHRRPTGRGVAHARAVTRPGAICCGGPYAARGPACTVCDDPARWLDRRGGTSMTERRTASWPCLLAMVAVLTACGGTATPGGTRRCLVGPGRIGTRRHRPARRRTMSFTPPVVNVGSDLVRLIQALPR